MHLETLDLSHFAEQMAPQYKRLSKTQIRLLTSQVPESFVARFKEEETAVKELLDVIYGTEDHYDQ